MADINAHSIMALKEDSRGEIFADQISSSTFGLFINYSATRITPAFLSSPGFVNFKRADWSGVSNNLKNKLLNMPHPTCIRKGDRILRSIIKRAAGKFIPVGVFPEIRPNFSSAACLADEVDTPRKNDHTNPRIQTLNTSISTSVKEHTRDKWRTQINENGFNPGSRNKTAVKQTTSNDQQHHFIQQHTSTRQQESLERIQPHAPSTSCVSRKAENKINSWVPQIKIYDHANAFSHVDVTSAIISIKNSKAFALASTHTTETLWTQPTAIAYVIALMNLCLTSLVILNIWKTGKVIPFPKPNKPINKGSSYPIAALSSCKIARETNTTNTDRAPHKSLSYQQGFKKRHIITTSLLTASIITSPSVPTRKKQIKDPS